MRYLASVPFEQLQPMRDRFRAGGIPIFVEVDHVRSNETAIVPAAIVSRFNLPAHWYRIDVCLDEQFDEAVRLFQDPGYSVQSPVDVEAFEKQMEELGANRPVSLRPSDETLNAVVGAAIAAIVVLGALFLLATRPSFGTH